MPCPSPLEHPLLHAGRALFAALSGDEAGVARALGALVAHDQDGRHRRWALEEAVFAPFRGAAWFAELLSPARVAILHQARLPQRAARR